MALSLDGTTGITSDGGTPVIENLDTTATGIAVTGELTTTGNAGIGASSPNYRLTVQATENGQGAAYIHNSGSNVWGLEIGVHSAVSESDLVLSGNAVIGSQSSLSFVAEDTGYFRWMTGGTSHKTGTAGATERMRIDSDGRVTMPYQPAFSASLRTGASSVTGDIVFETVFLNQGSHYSNSTGRFTAPVTGVYLLMWRFVSETSTTGSGPYTYLKKNGSQVSISNSYLIGAGSEKAVYNALPLQLTAGDYINVHVNPGYLGVRANPDYHNHFSGYLLG